MPEWIGRFRGRVSIAAFFTSEAWPRQVAGLAEADADGVWWLDDGTGRLDLPPNISAQLSGRSWLALTFRANEQASIDFVQPLQARGHAAELLARGDLMRRRWQVHGAMRDFFRGRGFLEVDTPTAVTCPGMEPYLDSFRVGDLYLRTSPELHMKRLLAAGLAPIFQIAPCFRAGDRGSQHREEFLMLEWYRLFADLAAIQDDCAALLQALAPLSQDPAYFYQEPETTTCTALFRKFLDLELTTEREPLIACLQKHGDSFDVDDDWDTLYFRLFLQHIEPHLGQHRPVFVHDYPATQAALAKKAPVREGEIPTCFRFELYVRGVELANAFYEVTDAVEQRARFEVDRSERAALGKPVYDLDEPFLDALASGLPPAAGIALGVDRLTALVLGADRLDAVLPFPPPASE